MNVSQIATGAVAVLLTTAVLAWALGPSSTPNPAVAPPPSPPMSTFKKPDPSQLQATLSAEQFKVTQQCGTEPPFRNAYWDNHKPGLYVDVVSGEPLFSSLSKFDSGSGWPSFTQPLESSAIAEKQDTSHGSIRTEVRSKLADSHLGHVFEDGPADKGGMRYCINSASLKFIPAEELEGAGFGKYLGPFIAAGLVKAAQHETAILAGGCFWGMEEILRKIPGVTKTAVGYSGGKTEKPTYKDVCTGNTGHAEAIEVQFDPAKLSYEALLGYFFRMHNPTTLNQQHNDIGTQYRSAIFYTSEAQRKTAEAVKAQLEKAKKFNRPITTEITPASKFYTAEDYHQKYLVKNPSGYNCHVLHD
jgi:peptide methionine sulfoxide reductase msrA/msrB